MFYGPLWGLLDYTEFLFMETSNLNSICSVPKKRVTKYIAKNLLHFYIPFWNLKFTSTFLRFKFYLKYYFNYYLY